MQNPRCKSEVLSEKKSERSLGMYIRVSSVLLWITLLLGVCFFFAVYSQPLGMVLLFALLGALTGIAGIIFKLRAGADISQMPWLQNTQWSIMNRRDCDENNERPD